MELEKVRSFLKNVDKENLKKKSLKNPFKRGTPHILQAEGAEWDLITALAAIAPRVRTEELVSILDITSRYVGAFELASTYLKQDIKHTNTGSIFIRFDSRLEIKQNLDAFKSALRREIKKKEGVLLFAEKIGMKQGSLSRLLHSKSMPDPKSLRKISLGLGLDKIEVKFEDSIMGQAFKSYAKES